MTAAAIILAAALVASPTSSDAQTVRVRISDPGPLPTSLRGPVGTVRTVGTLEGRVRVKDRVYPGFVEVRETVSGPIVVNVVPLEAYIAGVVESEVPSSWPPEALKAQAVIARTYVTRRARDARAAGLETDVVASVMDQAYGGGSGSSRVRRAVAATAGEILTFEGQPIQAFYHSTCGGRSEAVEEVFERYGRPPYLEHERCYCSEAPKYRWERTITPEDLRKALVLDRIVSVRVVDRTEAGRVRLVLVDDGGRGSVFKGTEFRRLVGYGVLPSTWFEIRRFDGEGLHLTGKGFGHGVGLCQWGARGMADQGFSYDEILAFYYPGTSLERNAGH